MIEREEEEEGEEESDSEEEEDDDDEEEDDEAVAVALRSWAWKISRRYNRNAYKKCIFPVGNAFKASSILRAPTFSMLDQFTDPAKVDGAAEESSRGCSKSNESDKPSRESSCSVREGSAPAW
jgi:hypothetical protein